MSPPGSNNSRSPLYVAIAFLCFFLCYVQYVSLRPSPYMIYFMQAVTITGPQRSMIPPVDLELQANRSNGVSSSSSDESNKQVPRQDFSSQRFAAKLHMINPIQLFVDYPVSHFIAIEMGLIRLEWITANVISLIHPIFGILAGYWVIKSTMILKGRSSSSSANTGGGSPSISPTSVQMQDIQTPPPGSNGGGGSASTVGVPPLTSPTADALPAVSRRTRSSANITSDEGGAVGGSPSFERLDTGSTTTTTINGSGLLSQGGGGKDGSGGAGGGKGQNDDFTTTVVNVRSGDANNEDKETAALLADASTKQAVHLQTLRWGCAAMMIRNTLDTLDGVFARLRKQARAPGTPPPKLFGLTGEVIDPVTDITGASCFAIGCAYFLFSRSVMISRIPSSILSKLGFRYHTQRPLLFSRLVICFGLLYISVVTSFWETFMLKNQALFDAYANHDEAIFALDSNIHVRLSEIFWAVTCGDSIFSVLVICTFFNCLWEAVQFYFFIGYAWLTCGVLYSYWVWNSVVLADPTAAAIVARNPTLF